MTCHRHTFWSLPLIVTLIALLSLQTDGIRAQQSAPLQPSQPQSPQLPDARVPDGAGAKAPAAPAAAPVTPPNQSGKAPDAASRPPAAGEGIPAVVVDGGQVMGILGRQVRSSAGEDMGRIVDVIIDRTARVRAVVIDFGGFLGVGNRQIAVAWTAIRLPAEDKPGALAVDFTRDQLRVAPAYKAGEQVVLLGQTEAQPAPAAPPATGATDKDAPTRDAPAKEPPSK